MKRINVLNGVVDSIEIGVSEDPSNTHPFVIEDDVEVFSGYISNGDGTFTAPPSPSPTGEDVKAERDRRRNIAVPVQVNSETEFYVDVDEKSRTFILAVEAMADLTTDNIFFTGADNVTRSLTPSEIKLMAAQVFSELARIHTFSNTIKAMEPIPADFTDDSYWV